MARLKIFTFPDDVLTKKAIPILEIQERHRQLANDMLETMYHAPGIGLAANQVGILERVIVLDIDYEMEEDPEGKGSLIKNKNPLIFFNPEIIAAEGKLLFEEGCLSVPDYNAEVMRSKKIRVRFLDVEGTSQEREAEGLLAVALQHEMDHLEGKLFIDRLSPIKKELARKKLRAERKFRDEEEKMGVFDPGIEAKKRRKKGI
jgi:peptide deformylase